MESGESSNTSSKSNESGEKHRGSSKVDLEDGPQASKRGKASEDSVGECSQASVAGDSVNNGHCSKDGNGTVDGEGGSSSSFPRRHRKNSRNYRRASNNGEDSSSSNDEMAPQTERSDIGVSNSGENVQEDERESAGSVSAFGSAFIVAFRNQTEEEDEEEHVSNPFDSDDETDEPSAEEDSDTDTDLFVGYGGTSLLGTDEAPDIVCIPCLNKEKPKHTWSVTKEVIARQYGMRSRLLASQRFTQKFAGSLHCVQRLELMSKLENHSGCVNSVQFSDNGDKLISGSDDKRVVVWNWSTGQSLLAYRSGHTGNIVQAQYLHDCNETHIVSCARDGQVRMAVLSSTGECRSVHRLAQHRRGANKFGTHPECPRNVLSVGEDAVVMNIDIRMNEAKPLLTVVENTKEVGLYSIHIHPMNYNEFCVSGVDRWIRIYDRRYISRNASPLKKYCPSALTRDTSFYNVTSAVYSHDGKELIGSYNDEDIYLFRTDHPDPLKHFHRYEGHKNCATVKSVNFFGPNSEFVMSGSDCGNIFFWEKETESIVQFMRGDEIGGVNSLVVHPQLPILATSGLDNDVKIWVPSCEEAPDLTRVDLRRAVTMNMCSKSYQHRNLFQRLLDFAPTIGFQQVFLEALRRSTVQPSVSSTDSSDESVGEEPSHCPPS